ncbi:MAG: glucose-1-phosphate cytidylyltransferase [Verrucomicrobia bacterium]|nr:glucose-1-phosphate cytidylyltransferase [Verrucomicrobiota bacterium]MBS0645408.1 glucose-1-phosphate cytidylyltransferase [Verrucomicrobiota bacterium]
MKTIILAGGLGTRLSEKTSDCPKPMVDVGGRPILWHIMQLYSLYDQNEFVLALGYKSEIVKQYFFNFYAMNNDLSVNLQTGETIIHQRELLPWTIHMVDTGLHTQTGGRLKRCKQWIGNERFMMTYGDGLSDVNIDELIDFHCSHGKLATVLSVRPPARFGELKFEEQRIDSFMEKPQIEAGWINGGFFVLEPEIFDYLEDDKTIWERSPLERLAQDKELMGFQHTGFWQPMDTLREWRYLQSLWESGSPPWLEKKVTHELLV